MSEVRIGVTVPQFTGDRSRFVDSCERAIALGFDSLWVFDHLWPLGGKRERPILECWTALAYVAATYPDVQVGTLVTRASLRHPVVVAKMAATLAAIAPDRVIVGLGSGDEMNKDENVAFGAPYYDAGDRVRQLVSTLEVVQRFLKTPEATLHDEFVDVRDLPSSPRPEPPPRVWIGGRSVELLEVAGRIADGWNGWGANLATFADDAHRVREIAGERAFDISWAGQVLLARDDATARERLGARDPAHFVLGGPETVRARLREAIAAGACHLIVALLEAGPSAYEDLAAVVEDLEESD
ncbi:MAG TPA: LLM class flavin-dependent oxidoreductase [Actinomycetota bacterium]|nr:LLM class flavin-dependent oxidoreductase [Actinomycetota bacterium]